MAARIDSIVILKLAATDLPATAAAAVDLPAFFGGIIVCTLLTTDRLSSKEPKRGNGNTFPRNAFPFP